jgi:hypothetical protein
VARCVLEYGVVPARPVHGAVYRIAGIEECDRRPFLALVELPAAYTYDADGFRPAVEDERELERLRWLCEGAPTIAPERRRELETVGFGIPQEGASGTAREAPSSALQAAPPYGPSSGAEARRKTGVFDALSRRLPPQGGAR